MMAGSKVKEQLPATMSELKEQSELKAYARKCIARQKAAANIMHDKLKVAKVMMEALADQITELQEKISLMERMWPRNCPMLLTDEYEGLSVAERIKVKAELDEGRL